ncbi:MAG: hypothetical protein HY784_15610, partial [Chloroflexi bacterium]|nr:hypothetical protein [Chloroflexota bacterium]
MSSRLLYEGVRETLNRARTAPALFDYFAQEVFETQPTEVREFLLGSALLQEMTPPAVDSLLLRRDSGQMLAMLEGDNLFLGHVDVDGELVYRYHQMFAQFLRTRLQETQPDLAGEYHRRASEWYHARSDPERAIHHALAGKHYEIAAALMQGAANALLRAGQTRVMAGWVVALPEEYHDRAPDLLYCYGRALADNGSYEEAERALVKAEAVYCQRSQTSTLASVLVDRALVARFRQRFAEGVQLADHALTLLLPSQAGPTGNALRSRGLCLSLLGDREHAEPALESAVRCLRTAGYRFDLAAALQDLGNFRLDAGK